MAGCKLTDRLSISAALGYGAGELRLMPGMPGGKGDGPFAADLTMAMGAAGMRGQVLTPPAEGGLALAVKGDTRFTRTASEATKDARGGGKLEAATATCGCCASASRARGASRPAAIPRAWC